MSSPILAIANRAEIAVRIARTARIHGWKPVALLGEPDWKGYAAREIGDVVRLGAGDERDVEAVVRAARLAGASALHPGYGFLSERAELSQACADAGITFIGPRPETLELAGDKIASREIAIQREVPVVPGSEALELEKPDLWTGIADDIGYPVIAKVAGAGGGRGLRVARTPDELPGAIQSALNEAGGSGAALELFLEHYLEGARHVEVQVAGDGTRAAALGDRDCSLQRRHQKVIEEGPALGLSEALRGKIHEAARIMAEGISLLNLATVEFLVGSDERFYFMEINPRLQVEHTVTEEVTGFDLVALQIDLAGGGELPARAPFSGHAIQARLYAEDPFQQFLPSPGEISRFSIPLSTDPTGTSLRVDAGYAAGDSVPGAYDPMVAKIIVHGPDRALAIDGLVSALTKIEAAGIATNRPWLLAALDEDSPFRSNDHDLTTAGEIVLAPAPPPDDALRALVATTARRGLTGATAWDLNGAFRLVSPATATFHGEEAAGWQKTVSLSLSHPNERGDEPLIVDLDSGWEMVTPEGRWLLHSGPKPSASQAAVGDGEIRAPMPGTVLQINAEPGLRVEEDEVVAVMEAMKIEISLAAPFAGKVVEVSASPGELVGLRQVIVTIEPAVEDGGNR